MRHSPNFDKIDSFLKPLLNIFIVSSLTVGLGEGVLKEGAGILHQIYRIKGGVNSWGSRFHQGKSWCYLGPSKTYTVELFCGDSFWLLAVNVFYKSSNLQSPVCLSLLFQ